MYIVVNLRNWYLRRSFSGPRSRTGERLTLSDTSSDTDYSEFLCVPMTAYVAGP